MSDAREVRLTPLTPLPVRLWLRHEACIKHDRILILRHIKNVFVIPVSSTFSLFFLPGGRKLQLTPIFYIATVSMGKMKKLRKEIWMQI